MPHSCDGARGSIMSWYEVAMSTIKEQRIRHPELSTKEMRDYCSKNYPFSERRGWAYKAWLRAMRDEFGCSRRRSAEDKKSGQESLAV